MKRNITILTLAAVGVGTFLVGCNPSDDQTVRARESTNTVAVPPPHAPLKEPATLNNPAPPLESLKKEASDAVQEAKDYAFAQRDQFAQSMRDKLAQLNKRMDELSTQIENATEPTKSEAQAKLQALREQAGKLNQQLDAAKDATESKWDEVKASTKKAYDDLKDSFNQARQWLSDKIAPSK